MKSFVLVSKLTGQLFEAWRINFLDAKHFQDDTPAPESWKMYMILDGEFGGYLVSCPIPEWGTGDFKVFFNRDGARDIFDCLGEL